MKRLSACGCRCTVSTICLLVLPASVNSTEAGAISAAFRTSWATWLTGVQTTTTSAPVTPSEKSVVALSIAPFSLAASSLPRSRPMPTTWLARPRARSARPMEPPISPTPTIATVSGRSKIQPSRATVPAAPVECPSRFFYFTEQSRVRRDRLLRKRLKTCVSGYRTNPA